MLLARRAEFGLVCGTSLELGRAHSRAVGLICPLKLPIIKISLGLRSHFDHAVLNRDVNKAGNRIYPEFLFDMRLIVCDGLMA